MHGPLNVKYIEIDQSVAIFVRVVNGHDMKAYGRVKVQVHSFLT